MSWRGRGSGDVGGGGGRSDKVGGGLVDVWKVGMSVLGIAAASQYTSTL